MYILIAGCSKIGASLAGQLSSEGHDVSVVDQWEGSQSLLPDDYTGYFSTGILIDEDVLRNAGIESCDAVAAVSDNDNVNIMVAQIAAKTFGIGTVITSLVDPAKEQRFCSLLTTVCPTNIAVASLKGYILQRERRQITMGSSTLDVFLMPVPPHLIGRRAADIDSPEGEMVLGVLPAESSTLQLAKDSRSPLTEGDRLAVVRIID